MYKLHNFLLQFIQGECVEIFPLLSNTIFHNWQILISAIAVEAPGFNFFFVEFCDNLTPLKDDF